MSATPNYVQATFGRLLIGGIAGDCASLMKWRLFFPENKKQLDNYCVAPMIAVNSSPIYVQCAGGWDAANPPHKYAAGALTYGNTVILYLGINTTLAGYLGTFTISSEESGHSLIEGADFQFQAHLQGTLTRLPL